MIKIINISKRFLSTELSWDEFFKLKVFAETKWSDDYLYSFSMKYQSRKLKRRVLIAYLKLRVVQQTIGRCIEKAALTGLPMIVS